MKVEDPPWRDESILPRATVHALIGALCGVVLSTGALVRAQAPNKPRVPPIGTAVADFTARDSVGASHSLSDAPNDKLIVLAFVGVECPLAKLYAPRLAALAEAYAGNGVVFFGVDSNRQDAVTVISAFARIHNITFPILKDLRQRIADRVGATRTPEVVVLDRERRICYRGRIDDQYGFNQANRAAGYHRTNATSNDLMAALDELLSGKPVSRPETAVAGCLIGHDRRSDMQSAFTYSKDIARILNKNCVSCHRPGQVAPFPLTSYEEVAGWADMIAEVTQTGRMPPWQADPKYGKFSNDARLNEADKRALAEWSTAGAPEGDRKDLPQPPKFSSTWTIPEPDQVIYMPGDFDVPATGVVELQNFLVDPGWKGDRWISAVELRPGEPSVVHHILIFVVPPDGGVPPLRSNDSFLMAYVAGLRQEALPLGYARCVPAGSKLIFNVHYTPNGTTHKDRSYVGVKFADPASVRRQVTICAAINMDFRIPPGVRNYEVHSQYVFNRDSLLLTLTPHMHLRGKDFLYEALFPDGRREVLLSVPRYDFDWQTMYRLAAPKLMPEGTALRCVAHFDNSEDNPNNPDPKAAVTFGWQSFNEMMVGYFEAAPAEEGSIIVEFLASSLQVRVFANGNSRRPAHDH